MSLPTITVLHNIFLTREERYKLAGGEAIEAVGVSVPVWFYKGKTTEPAVEIFCKYRLTNVDAQTPISTYEEGYLVNIPQANEKMTTIKNVLQVPQLGVQVEPPTGVCLKDIKDGGSDGYLQFRQYTKMRKGDKNFNLLHFVEIKKIEVLMNTLAYI